MCYHENITSKKLEPKKPGILLRIPITICGLLLFMNCERLITGMGPQPSYFDEHEHKPLMNIFGILRPGEIGEMPMSYIHLEKSFPFTSFPDTIEISDAEVKLFRINENECSFKMSFFFICVKE